MDGGGGQDATEKSAGRSVTYISTYFFCWAGGATEPAVNPKTVSRSNIPIHTGLYSAPCTVYRIPYHVYTTPYAVPVRSSGRSNL